MELLPLQRKKIVITRLIYADYYDFPYYRYIRWALKSYLFIFSRHACFL